MKSVYVIGNTRHVFRYKIGISKNVSFRRASIGETLKGETYVIFHATFYGAETVEKAMHTIYSPLNAKMKGSGKTEWFWMILPVTPIILLCLIWILQRGVFLGVILGLFYLIISNLK